jgi:hypothetical protein
MMIVVIRASKKETEGKKRRKQAFEEKRETETETEKRTSFNDRCASLSYLKNRQDSK